MRFLAEVILPPAKTPVDIIERARRTIATIDTHRTICYNNPPRGAVAQLGERLNGIQEVVGSIPIGSTRLRSKLRFELRPGKPGSSPAQFRTKPVTA